MTNFFRILGVIRDNIAGLSTVVCALVLASSAIRGVVPTPHELAKWLTWNPLPDLVVMIFGREPQAGTPGTKAATPLHTGMEARIHALDPVVEARMQLSRLDIDLAIVEADLQHVSGEARADKLAERDDLRAARARVAAQAQGHRRD